MKTAFVTGATGFVGLNLVAELVEQGWRVTALHRRSSRLDDLRRFPVTLVEGELKDPLSLRSAIPAGTDVLFHVAANTSFWSRRNREQARDNVDGVRNVLEAARGRVGRLIHTSSVAAYGRHAGRVTEETPPAAEPPWINYYRTKRLGERVVEEAIAGGLDGVIMAPTNVVGPYDRHNWSRMVRLVADGKLPGAPPGRNSWCHAREVARAHVAAAERGRTGEHYILACLDATYLEFIRVAGEVTGRAVPVRPVPALLLRAFARANVVAAAFTGREPEFTPESVALVCDDVTYDGAKARRELGYRPATLRQMVEDCWAWLQAQTPSAARRGQPSSPVGA